MWSPPLHRISSRGLHGGVVMSGSTFPSRIAGIFFSVVLVHIGILSYNTGMGRNCRKGGKSVNIDELEKRLTESSAEFSHQIQTYLQSSDCDPDTRLAIDEMAKWVFYTLLDYRDAIVEYERSR